MNRKAREIMAARRREAREAEEAESRRRLEERRAAERADPRAVQVSAEPRMSATTRRFLLTAFALASLG
jgi:hypothetical protein